MRVAGATLALLGLISALALPVVGTPGAFGLLLITAPLLWLVGAATAAACLAPPRLLPGLAALAAMLLALPLLLVYGLSPLWGALAVTCGLVVAIRGPAMRSDRPGSPSDAAQPQSP